MNTLITSVVMAAMLLVPAKATAVKQAPAETQVTAKAAEPKILTLGELSKDPSGKAVLLGYDISGDTVIYHMKTEEKAGEATVERIEDPTLEEGKEVVVQEGTLGRVEVKYDIITDFDGNRIDTKQVSRTVIQEAKNGIIKVGTKK